MLGGIYSTVTGHKSAIPRNPQLLPEESTDGMRAAYYTSHGGPEVLEFSSRFPKPIPAAGQVLVKVHYAALNPVDIKFRATSINTSVIPLPKITGADFSGEVISASPQGSLAVGDRVMGMYPLLFSGWGSVAELVAIDEDLLAKVPTNVSMRDAASMPLAATTVLQAFRSYRSSHPSAPGSVLIQAASGGVGSLAVQFCKNVLGMHVTGTCSGNNRDLVLQLGADEALDYTTFREGDGLAERLRGPVDVVFDPKSYLYEQSTVNDRRILKPHGYYINIASSPNAVATTYRDPLNLSIPEAQLGTMLSNITSYTARNLLHHISSTSTHYDYVFVQPNGTLLREMATYLEQGKMHAVIDREYALEDIVEAHRFVESERTKGKVIIRVKAAEDE